MNISNSNSTSSQPQKLSVTTKLKTNIDTKIDPSKSTEPTESTKQNAIADLNKRSVAVDISKAKVGAENNAASTKTTDSRNTTDSSTASGSTPVKTLPADNLPVKNLLSNTLSANALEATVRTSIELNQNDISRLNRLIPKELMETLLNRLNTKSPQNNIKSASKLFLVMVEVESVSLQKKLSEQLSSKAFAALSKNLSVALSTASSKKPSNEISTHRPPTHQTPDRTIHQPLSKQRENTWLLSHRRFLPGQLITFTKQEGINNQQTDTQNSNPSLKTQKNNLNLIQSALVTHLPQQKDLKIITQDFSALSRNIKTTNQLESIFGKELATHLHKILKTQSNNSNLNTNSLISQLKSSGIFLENRLKNLKNLINTKEDRSSHQHSTALKNTNQNNTSQHDLSSKYNLPKKNNTNPESVSKQSIIGNENHKKSIANSDSSKNISNRNTERTPQTRVDQTKNDHTKNDHTNEKKEKPLIPQVASLSKKTNIDKTQPTDSSIVKKPNNNKTKDSVELTEKRSNQEQNTNKIPKEKDILSNDIKSLLLQALTSLPARSTELVSQTNSAIDVLIHNFLRAKNQQERDAQKPHLKQVLRQLIQSTLSKITSSQLQNLNAATKDPQSKATLNIETPIKISDSWIPLNLQIQEQENLLRDQSNKDHKNENNEHSKQKKRSSWRVYLEFEFPQHENFVCEINLSNNILNSSLWTDDSKLMNEINKHLPELSKELTDIGVEVESLNCVHQKPVNQKQNIKHCLVDIKT